MVPPPPRRFMVAARHSPKLDQRAGPPQLPGHPRASSATCNTRRALQRRVFLAGMPSDLWPTARAAELSQTATHSVEPLQHAYSDWWRHWRNAPAPVRPQLLLQPGRCPRRPRRPPGAPGPSSSPRSSSSTSAISTGRRRPTVRSEASAGNRRNQPVLDAGDRADRLAIHIAQH